MKNQITEVTLRAPLEAPEGEIFLNILEEIITRCDCSEKLMNSNTVLASVPAGQLMGIADNMMRLEEENRRLTRMLLQGREKLARADSEREFLK